MIWYVIDRRDARHRRLRALFTSRARARARGLTVSRNWSRCAGAMYGYAFRGLGKRNRAAFKEAASPSNTRIPRVTGAKRGVGEVAGAKSDDVAFGDVTNAARRGEASEARRIAALREERVKEESAEEALQAAEAAARAASEDAAQCAQEGFRVADSVVTNVPNVGEEAARPALGGDAIPVGDEIDGTGEAAEGENAQTNDIGGAENLRHVDRAKGINAASALRALVDAGGGDAVARCLAGDCVVAGVDVAEAIRHLVGWVRPSIGAEAFQGWLNTKAPAFPALTIEEDSVSTIFLGDGAAAMNGLREFVADDENGSSPGKLRSPLLSGESTFARLKYNAVYAAAWALGASDDERREALAEAARHSNTRVFNVRATYVWFIRCESGRVYYVYVGESIDVERRTHTHVENLFDRQDDDPRLQRGHALARRECAAATKDQAHFFILSAHNEQSARSLAQSYVCANIRCDRFSDASMTCRILEVARACAASGFYSEVVYTAQFRSMYAERTAERVGLNFSQPGVMHPQGSGIDAIDTMTWEQVKAKFGKTTTAGSRAQSEEPPSRTCRECNREIQGQSKTYLHGNGGGRKCDSCYQKDSRAKRPAFTCVACNRQIAPGRQSYRAEGDGGGRVCKGCYNRQVQAKRPGFTCAACDKKVPPGQRMHSYGVADKCCEACYQNALQEKQPGFTCAMCHDEFPRGNLNYPHDGAGGGRVCKSCYRYMKKYRNVAPK